MNLIRDLAEKYMRNTDFTMNVDTANMPFVFGETSSNEESAESMMNTHRYSFVKNYFVKASW